MNDPRTHGTMLTAFVLYCLHFPRTHWFNYHLVVSLLANKASCLTGRPSEWVLLSPVCAGKRFSFPVWPKSYWSTSKIRLPFTLLSLRIINILLFSPFVSDRCSTFVKAATAESPIRGLKPPRGLTFGSVIGAPSCQVLPCVQKSLAAPWHVTLGL